MSTSSTVVLGDHEIPIIKRGDDNTHYYDISVLTHSDFISPFANVKEIANHICVEKTSKGNQTTLISLNGLQNLVSVLAKQLEHSPNALISSQLQIVKAILPVIQFLENEKSSSVIEKEDDEQSLDLQQSKDVSPQTSPLQRPKASSHILTQMTPKTPKTNTSSPSSSSTSTSVLSPIFPSSSSLLSPNALSEDTFEHQQSQQLEQQQEQEQKKCVKKTEPLDKYRCDCGKTFTSSQAKAGHCHFCAVHQANRNKSKMGLYNTKRQRDDEEYDESYSSDDLSREKYRRSQRGREQNTQKLLMIHNNIRTTERNTSHSLLHSHSLYSTALSSDNICIHTNSDLCENGKRILRSPIPSRSPRRSTLLDDHSNNMSDCEDDYSVSSVREFEEEQDEDMNMNLDMNMNIESLNAMSVYFGCDASNNARFHQCYHRTVQSTRLICEDNERLRRLTEKLESRMECLKEQQNVF